MLISLKNKHTLQVDDFLFRCTIGKKGLAKKKFEGDKKTPIGIFKIEHLYYRKDRIPRPDTKLKIIEINKSMGWCDDIKSKKNYNKLINVNERVSHEKLFRKDHKYDLIIPIKYNYLKPIKFKGSCIFIHLTDDYKATAGCIGLKKKDFLIMIRLINKKTKIQIN